MVDISLNGHNLVTGDPLLYVAGDFQTLKTLTMSGTSDGFQAGTNTLVFTVNNATTSPNPSGILVKIDKAEADVDPTAVTIGKVGLKTVPVSDFLPDPSGAEALSRLDPDADGRVPVVFWNTLSERGTIGFYVQRRRLDGSWMDVNKEMLPGLITAPLGGEYQLADPSVKSGILYQYRLIEQEARGSVRYYGPYSLEMSRD